MKKTSKTMLISGLTFFVLGIIIFLYPKLLVKVISYGLGGLLILTGIYRTINYYVQDKKLGIVNRNELAFGITAIVLGILFIFLVDAIQLLIKIIVGGWLIIAGINKIIKTFFIRERDAKFYALIVIGLILIGIGLYIIIALNILSIIGLFMMMYGLIDFISYFVYKDEKNLNDIVIKTDVVIEEAEVVEKD